MSTLPTRFTRSSQRRRSQRVLLPVRILVSGVRPDGELFAEGACTSVVNSHGALMVLAERVNLGQLLTVRNLHSYQEVPCEVVAVGPAQAAGCEVGIEFLTPAPFFWRIAFPPENWSPRSPEAKHITIAPTPFPNDRLSK